MPLKTRKYAFQLSADSQTIYVMADEIEVIPSANVRPFGYKLMRGELCVGEIYNVVAWWIAD